jgi:hypothetical protein
MSGGCHLLQEGDPDRQVSIPISTIPTRYNPTKMKGIESWKIRASNPKTLVRAIEAAKLTLISYAIPFFGVG